MPRGGPGGDLARSLALAALYSLGTHGIMTLNDFKSVEGDRRMGIRSLPVQLGADGAARVASLVMLLAQAAVIALLASWQRTVPAIAIGVLTLVQAVMMWRFVQAPRERALWLSALGVPFYVGGMMIAAFAVRSLPAVVGAAP